MYKMTSGETKIINVTREKKTMKYNLNSFLKQMYSLIIQLIGSDLSA